MTFEQQLAAFADASIIVGPHGASLTNMIFAPDGVRVIEIANKDALLGYTTALADSFGVRLTTILGASAPAATSRQPADYYVDLNETLAAIDAVIAETKRS